MKHQRLWFTLTAIPFVLATSLAMGAGPDKDSIGMYTAVSGRVTVTHSGDAQVLPVKLHDQVLFKDVIETLNESRTKAFFEDDSMLTVGENSRVEINEYVYQPEHNIRRAIVKLMQGQVRALVSKIFKANGSKFEVHTPSAVAAARGTYFTVWYENGQSGIINIGEKGRVDFTSGGSTVAVDPGSFSIAQAGGVPSLPKPHDLGVNIANSGSKNTENKGSALVKAPERTATSLHQRGKVDLPLQASQTPGLAQALAAVEGTILRDSPLIELPAQALQALNVDGHLLQGLTSLAGLSIDSLLNNNAGSSTVTTGTVTTGTLANGTLTVGSVSVGTGGATGGGSLAATSVTVGSTTVTPLAPVTTAVGAVAPVVSSVVAPVTPIVSTVVAPVAPVVSAVVSPVIPVISTVVAPVAPMIAPVVAPIAPIVAPIAPVIAPVVAPVAPVIAPVVAPLAPIINPLTGGLLGR
jgi:hypothetical protein